MSVTNHTPTLQFPNIHLHGVLVAVAGILGCYAAGLLPTLGVPANSTVRLLALGFFLIGGAAGFPALVVKSYVDRRWSVIAYGIPVVALVAYAALELVGLGT